MMNSKETLSSDQELLVGIDVGSTTTKIVAVDPEQEKILYSNYRRHHAKQLKSVMRAVEEFAKEFPDAQVRIALTGSGAKPVAKKLDVPFVQEVAANAIASRTSMILWGVPLSWAGRTPR